MTAFAPIPPDFPVIILLVVGFALQLLGLSH
jgi:hypothetical protein